MHRDVCGVGSGDQMSPLPASAPPPSTVSSSSPTAASSIGVNLRVTGHCNQGGRKYMEDFFSVAYHESENTQDLEYAFVGIYDGHGGSEAATFAKEHLMMEIINQKLFWSDCDQDVLRAIREGYIATHYAMWREQEKWPKTTTGLPSTAGTTATVAFIRHEKIYIGHVGDSGIVLGYQNEDETFWRAKPLTQDHKPESTVEKNRIVNSGGKVVVKSGVPRVVWNRPRTGHKGPVRRSTPIDEIPFLAVARSLGDLWSYNSALNEFVVSPDPDVKVIKINPKTFRCLIFGTDGLWNVMSPGDAVDIVHEKEIINDGISKMRGENNTWCNPSKGLVERALKTWSLKKMRADNTSVVTVILYPPGETIKNSSVNECSSSYGVDYMRMNTDINLRYDLLQMRTQSGENKFQSSSVYDIEKRLYDTDSFDLSHQLPQYDTIAPSSAMRQHMHNEDVHMPSFHERDDSGYANNYETNCDNNGYLYYDDQGSNNYINSFAESYNSLLTSTLEREDNSRSNDSSFDSISDESNESKKTNPNNYHSYNSLHHTGIAGHDRVQHHYPNNEYQMEQQLYQEQCMSAEEGYSLTKLETRGEQQLRGKSSGQISSYSSLQSFQIFGGEPNNSTEESFCKYINLTSNFQKGNHASDNSNSNFLSSYEDNARCYEPNMDVSTPEVSALPLEVEQTTSLCIERLDIVEDERLAAESTDKKIIKDQIGLLEEEIQIHEISSSVVDRTVPSPEPPEPNEEFTAKTFKEQYQSTVLLYESAVESTPAKKPPVPKLVLYPNVPNENYRTSRRPSVQQYPRNFEKRMLRSMTLDYNKRTLRSRNSLSKDMKSKNSVNSSLRKSNIVHNKFIKDLQSSNTENSNVISRNSLCLRSREITTTTEMWSESSGLQMSTPSSSQKPQRKSKPNSFDSSGSHKVTSGNDSGPSTGLRRTSVVSRVASSSSSSSSCSPIHLQQQVTISFAKRSSLKNTGWGSVKSQMQTRNRVQKRLSR